LTRFVGSRPVLNADMQTSTSIAREDASSTSAGSSRNVGKQPQRSEGRSDVMRYLDIEAEVDEDDDGDEDQGDGGDMGMYPLSYFFFTFEH